MEISNIFYVTSSDDSYDHHYDDFCLVLLCHPLTQSLNLSSNDTDASSVLLVSPSHLPTMTTSWARSFVELFWVAIDFVMVNVYYKYNIRADYDDEWRNYIFCV